MGVFSKRMTFANFSGDNSEAVDAIIDTGSNDCVVPDSLARRLGLHAIRTRRFAVADGRASLLPIAGVRVKLEGEVAFATAAIVPDPAQPILGAGALASMGLGVEPGTEKLIPRVVYLLTMTDWRTI